MFETLDSVMRSTKNLGFWMQVPRRMKAYEPRVQLKILKPPYVIRTVSTRKEFQQVLSLRYSIFEREFRGNWIPFGWDADEYDFLGDHLVIEDTRTGRIIGTYRLICSRFSALFYTASEFELDSFLATPGVKLELGRACIHPLYRNGAVMGLIMAFFAMLGGLSGGDLVLSRDENNPTGELAYKVVEEVFERFGHPNDSEISKRDVADLVAFLRSL